VSSYTGNAEKALQSGDPGRATALADQALVSGEALLPAVRVKASALTQLLRMTGLIAEKFEPGHTSPSCLRRGSHGEGMCDLVEELQRSFYCMAGEGESQALESNFELAKTLQDVDVMRQPQPDDGREIVLSMTCCERPLLLERTLGDLLASDLPPSELVFFEDASRDHRVRQMLEGLDAGPHRVHIIANRGFATRSWPANQNVVMRYARQEIPRFRWFVTCDADMALGADWWSATRTLFERFRGQRLPEGRLGVVTTFHPESSHPVIRTVEREGVEMRIKETVGGCQISIPRETLDASLGPLDHRSDWGWSVKLRAAGQFVGATSPSRSQHLGRESLLFHSAIDTASDFEMA